MRYFVTGEQNRHLLLNTIVLLFLVYMLVLWISIGLMYFHKMDLGAASVVEYYLGSETKFTEPRSYQSMLEVSHAHMFSMGMLAVTLTHLLLFANLPVMLKVVLSALVYLSAIGDEVAGWLVRFAHPSFAYLKIAMFVTLEFSLGVMIVLVSASLWAQRSSLKIVQSQKRSNLPKAPPETGKERS
jgi:hypothetical protein